MDFAEELEKMRLHYENHPLDHIELKRPYWMEDSDELTVTYEEKDLLVKNGILCYACVVQANVLLFKLFPPHDCPAMLLYSTDSHVRDNPEILMETAWLLYSYKDVPLEQVPEKWREMARCVTDELDRSGFSFSVTEEDGAHIEMHAITNMMHRRYLPGRKLSGSLLPVFAMPNQCKTVVVLPPEYWTRDFKKAWRKGLI